MAQLQDLRAQAQNMGLPTWGTIQQLQARIAEAEAAGPPAPPDDDPLAKLTGEGDGDGGDAADAAGSGTPGPDPSASPAPPAAAPDPPAVSTQAVPDDATVYTNQYATHAPPDETTHATLCAQVRDDAIRAGYRTRGTGQRVRTVFRGGERYEEYAVTIRR